MSAGQSVFSSARSPVSRGLELSRRNVLVLAGAGLSLVATACSQGARQAPEQDNDASVEGLLAKPTFYVAHRGSQDNWPEHTAEAYRQSLDAGSDAIEVSVHETADGIFVCHHDANTLRMTGVDRLIRESTYDQLLELSNDAKPWLGQGSPVLPIPKLTDILDQYAASSVVFLEDKASGDPAKLLDIMDQYPDSTEHFVWKQSGTSNRHHAARERGYTTWGYFVQDEMDRLTKQEVADFDLIGVQWQATDQDIRRAVSFGKPVVCWEIHTRSERDRVVNLGIQGIMCANIPYVMTDTPSSRADAFVTGRRAPGDLPYALAWTHQPVIEQSTSSVRLDHPVKASYIMGSMCPVEGEAGYRILVDMRWPEKLPQETEHAGVAFGQSDDSPYRVREPSRVGGYHFVQRMDGALELFGRQAGEVSGYLLGTVATAPPVAGIWMQYEVRVTPSSISVARLDGRGEMDWTVTSDSTIYRGGYFSLCRNYDGTPAVEFRSLKTEGISS